MTNPSVSKKSKVAPKTRERPPARSKRRHTLEASCWCGPSYVGIVDGLKTWKHHDDAGAMLISEQRRELSLKEARKELGHTLKSLREKSGLTQRQVAEQLGVKDNWVYIMERGTSAPSIGMLQLLAEVYDVTVDELLGSTRFPKRGS